MKFKKLTASFGRLENETITLHDGLNIVTAPNESGKSTWAAFVLAMLYGVDTSERKTKTNLPLKEKYKPWSGAPMAGSMDVEWRGRAITLERGPLGRTPMGAFAARLTNSGQDVPELTAENCGRMLIGAERSVFERSALIRQAGLAVTPDQALEQRLSALVTTGEEGPAYSQIRDGLSRLKNSRKHNKTGLIPQAEAELDAIDDALAAIRAGNAESAELTAKLRALEAQRSELARMQAAVQARAQAEKLRALHDAEASLGRAHAQAEAAAQDAAGLPDAAELSALRDELTALLARPAVPDPGPAPEAPAAPPFFEGFSGDRAVEQAEKTAAQYDALRAEAGAVKKTRLLPIAAIAAALGIALLFVLPPAGAAMLAAAAVCAALALRETRSAASRRDAAARQAEALLAGTGYDSTDALCRAARDYRDALLRYGELSAAHARAAADAEEKRQAQQAQTAAFLKRSAAVAPAASLSDCRAALLAAIARRAAADEAARCEAEAASRLAAVRQAIGDIPETASDAPDDGTPLPSPESLLRQSAQADDDLRAVRSRLDRIRGGLYAHGDPAELSARREALLARLALLRAQYDALETALDALDQANAQLQTRFAPQLGREAARILSRLTGGRYEDVLLQSDLSLSARAAGDVLTRPLAYLSGGTADQLYLAVRLAIAGLALPADTPLLLDDALVQFDDARMAAAMAVLRGIAATRQIILFTCQSREQAWLDAHT